MLRILFHGVGFALIASVVLFTMNRLVWARLIRDAHLPRVWRLALTAVLLAFALAVPLTFLYGRQRVAGDGWPFVEVVWTGFGFVFYAFLLVAVFDLVRFGFDRVRYVRRRAASAAEIKTPPNAAPNAAPNTSGATSTASATASAARRGSADIPQPFSTASVDAAPDATAPTSPAVEAPSSPRRVDPTFDHGRRILIARSIAGAVTLGAGATTVVGRRSAGEITTPEIEVTLARLPRAMDGFRIVQISDVHMGPVLAHGFLEHVVDVIHSKKPDLVVITGDLVDAPVKALAREMTALTTLRARHGVHFVTGNHEYYSGADEWIDWLKSGGIRVLQNERVVIGDAGASFDLAGIPDVQGAPFGVQHDPDLASALVGRDPERELVLLAHRPSQIAMALRHDVGLQLSGHTHGGQMWPFGALVSLAEPYLAGLHREGPRTQIYVSRGTGFWGPPMRVGNPAEVTTIVLRSGA